MSLFEFDKIDNLSTKTTTHAHRPKISVYCCGSYPVKRTLEGLCKALNESAAAAKLSGQVPYYAYHEENF